jgi:hypothetical protein
MIHTPRQNILLLLPLVLVSVTAVVQQKATTPRKITIAEAKELVTKAVESSRGKSRGFFFEQTPEAPYEFEVRSDKPTAFTYPLIGHFAVDPSTGDVWDAIVCREYTSQPLRKLQQTIRKRIGLTAEEYQKLKKPGPMCPGLLAPPSASSDDASRTPTTR